MKKKMRKPFISKQNFKRRYKRCAICHDDRYEILDVHRWRVEGKDGGKYTSENSIVICTKCHRLIHSGVIRILGTYPSTKGDVVHYMNEKEEENFSEL